MKCARYTVKCGEGVLLQKVVVRSRPLSLLLPHRFCLLNGVCARVLRLVHRVPSLLTLSFSAIIQRKETQPWCVKVVNRK